MKIFIDLEMNPISNEFMLAKKRCRKEVIQIGAVALDNSNEIIDDYSQLVKPEFSNYIRKYIFKLTGISSEAVREGVEFRKAIHDFASWCKDISNGEDYEIYAWSEHDIDQLRQEMMLKNMDYFMDNLLMTNWVDYQVMFSNQFGFERIMSLDKAVELLGIDFYGKQHNAVSDALNTARIYQISQNESEFTRLIEPVRELFEQSEPLCNSIGSIFKNLDFNSALGLT